MSSAIGYLLCNLAHPSKKVLIPLFSILTLLSSFNALAANGPDNAGRADYDLDDNGLIEINDLADLDEIRNNLDGKALYGSKTGCPDAEDGTVNGGCKGFELTADLDFDTNGNGVVDDEDGYRNITQEGIARGWEPIGDGYPNYFTAHFNGNGYVIKNLTINRPSTFYVGLFGLVKDSTIESVVIAGLNSEVIGKNYVAALVGYAQSNTHIRNVVVVANVQGEDYVAGLVGWATSETHIGNSFVSGSVSGDRYVAGLLGWSHGASNSTNSISQSLSTSFVMGNGSVGGLIGYSYNTNIINSYWAKGISGQDSSAGRSEANSYVGLNLATLQCATAENTDSSTGCVSDDGSVEGLNATVVLYKDWDPTVWDFGIAPNANQQLPGLKLNGKVFRDSDGDGSLDGDDKWPLNYAASKDKDGDDYPDAWSRGCDDACILASGLTLDQFPHHAWAAVDADFDGLPDGAENCVSDCQLGGLTKDGALGDYDNDGILDADDTDENNDGINDVDADHDGLIDIDSLDKLNAMRYQLQGVGLQLTEDSNVEVSGCPYIIHQGIYQQRCSGYELTQDLNFDSNADGIVDEYDDYRNINLEGIAEGWEPIGSSNDFSAIFNGNGHVIKNLTINRPFGSYASLFGYVKDSVIENVAIAGLNSEITGGDNVAALVGYLSNAKIRNVLVVADVAGRNDVGGVVGNAVNGAEIENVFASGSVTGFRDVGGIVGSLSDDTTSIKNMLSTSFIVGNSSGIGGLIGFSWSENISNSYWAKDSSGQDGSYRSSGGNSYVGLNLLTLQCATAENTDSTSGCVSIDGSDEGLSAAVVLYRNWDSAVWDFGVAPNANQQLPGLKLNGKVFRDSDGDGSLDTDDIWPNNSAASQDLDADGYPDVWSRGCNDACILASGLTLDQFPHHSWAAVDADFDGLPDGAENCVSNCQLDGLTKDGALGDYDNDGILDEYDTDENNDGINDIDADHDGLIELDSLDKLNAMRFQLQGVGLQLSDTADIDSSGCPRIIYQGAYRQRCSGYELTQSLDFDSNADGIVDEYDDYRNINLGGVAEGWEPVGDSSSNYFSAHFNGNGHVIKNLTINRPETYNIGLFGVVKNTVIEDVAIAGPSSEIIGRNNVAALVGYALGNIQIRNVVIVAKVEGDDYVSGLVAQAYLGTHIENSFVSGSVSGDRYIGGLVGESRGENSNSKNTINQSLSTSFVMGNSSVGGLIGYSYNTNIINSYWAKGVSGQASSSGRSEANGYVGLTLVKLQCAIAENTSSSTGCVSVDGSDEGLNAAIILYKDWDSEIWDFGIAPNANQQLPGLKLNGKVFRDSDGDGSLDGDDKWPLNYAASIDKDGDDYPDSWSLGCDDVCILASGLALDQFPHHSWAALDADFDGMPDGAENCVSDCQLEGLTKDGALGDHDNDGILGAEDRDEYGVLKVDMDGDGLIDIDSLDKLNAMRFQLQGVGLQLTDISDVDMSGCPFIIYQGIYQQRCSGYELTRDLDFDTNDNGEFDSQDAYWNENSEGIGEGWLPVGGYYDNEDYFFEARFNGNGHVINNLTINRPGANNVGLFGVVNNSYIENLAIGGLLTEVVGYENVGALAGVSIDSEISNISVTARIQSHYYAGGLAGSARRSSYKNIFVSGSVTGEEDTGGLSGEFISGSSKNVISNSLVSGDEDVGGLVGDSNSEAMIRNSYWAIDTSTQSESYRSSEANSYVGLTLAKLQCALAENTDFTTGCVSEDGLDEGLNSPVILYKDWDPEIWDFGTDPNANEQLPALKINGRVIRDRDADEVFDTEDAFPLNLAAAIDDDNDGMPDLWNSRCDEQCQTDSGLVLDPFLNDTDNDGVENDFVPDEEEPVIEEPPVVEPPITEPPVIEPPANPSSGEATSSGGSSGGGAMAWMLLLLMTLAILGQYRRNTKIEKHLF